MKVVDALQSVERIYVESAPLIYYVEENPTYIDRMDVVIDIMLRNAIQGVCSVLILTEVLPIPLRTGRKALVQEYQNILLNSREFVCLEINRQIAELAANIRAQYNVRTPDSLHLATAIHTNCDAFLTNDLGLKRITELRILVLDELELEPPES